MRIRFVSTFVLPFCLGITTSSAAPLTENNILAVADNVLHEFASDGNLVQQFTIPITPGPLASAHHLTVIEDGRVAVLSGRESPFLKILDPETGVWEEFTWVNWTLVAPVNHGGVAAKGDQLFITSTEDPDGGVFQFNLTTNTETLVFNGDEAKDLSLGPDDKLYVAKDGGNVLVIDSTTFVVENTLSFEDRPLQITGVTVHLNGDVYTSWLGGRIDRHDSDGNLVDSLETGLATLTDLDLGLNGQLVASGSAGDIVITDQAFSSVQIFDSNPSSLNPAYVAYVPIEDAEEDQDGDGVEDQFDNCVDVANPDQTDTDFDGFGDACDDDDDNDGMADDYEIANGLDPLDPADADLDNDGDGVSNLLECEAGTDPNDPDDTPDVTQEHFESFEDAGLPGDWSVSTGFDGTWQASVGDARHGQQALNTSLMISGQIAAVEWTQLFAAGEVSFDVKVGASFADDILRLYVDGLLVLEDQISGVWSNHRAVLDEGMHTLRWEYRISGTFGSFDRKDAMRLDNVAFYIVDDDNDSDGILNTDDKCFQVADAGQEDFDSDALGDACDEDDDGDGMSDVFEQANALDALDASDRLADPDDDQLESLREFQIGTLASTPDSDGDGMSDGVELSRLLSPTRAFGGNQANAASSTVRGGAVSGTGRFVVFSSDADNLVANDNNANTDIFLFDKLLGSIIRLSVGGNGEEGNHDSVEPSISADGRFVAFASTAGNLIEDGPADPAFASIVVHDGVTGLNRLASLATSGEPAFETSGEPRISASGRYVVFTSSSNNLDDTFSGPIAQVFRHDLATGHTVLVSRSEAGDVANGESGGSTISEDGRYVAFGSLADNLAPGDTNGVQDIFVRDLTTGAVIRASVSSGGVEADGMSEDVSLSPSGQYVAFASDAANLDAQDSNSSRDVFVFDQSTGQIVRASVHSSGAQAQGQATFQSYSPAVTDDGRVLFVSTAGNLVDYDTNLTADVFAHDLVSGATTRVAGTGVIHFPPSPSFVNGLSVSKDGQHLAFTSDTDELIMGDDGGDADVFASKIVGAVLDPSNAADAVLDLDGDTLANLVETQASTDPFVSDSDGDQLLDGEEIDSGLNPLLLDSDGDFLQEMFELDNALEADNVDTDGDGLNDGSEDLDRDGLSNLAESLSLTDPINADSDGDGLPDAFETFEVNLSPIDASDAAGFATSVLSLETDDTVRSGRIGNNGATTLVTLLSGPAELVFEWKVSSQPDADVLSFLLIDDAASVIMISGEQDWAEQRVDIADGEHLAVWQFSKDSVAASGNDAGWIRNVQLIEVPGGSSTREQGIPLGFVDSTQLSGISSGDTLWALEAVAPPPGGGGGGGAGGGGGGGGGALGLLTLIVLLRPLRRKQCGETIERFPRRRSRVASHL